jgi:hypothetical protein
MAQRLCALFDKRFSHPDVKCRLHTVKYQAHAALLCQPLLWHVEPAAVASRLVLRRYKRRLDPAGEPRVLNVCVDRSAKAVHLPVRRHLYTKRLYCLKFSYASPEPVLVKCLFSYWKWLGTGVRTKPASRGRGGRHEETRRAGSLGGADELKLPRPV